MFQFVQLPAWVETTYSRIPVHSVFRPIKTFIVIDSRSTYTWFSIRVGRMWQLPSAYIAKGMQIRTHGRSLW